MVVVAKQRIQSLDRGLQILKYVAEQNGPAERISKKGIEKLARLVKQWAKELSVELGHQAENL